MIPVERRTVLAGLLPATFALGAGLAGAPALATTNGNGPGGLDGKTRLWLRLVADLSGRSTYAVERGNVWGFKPQGDDLTVEAFAKRLYGYWSLVARRAQPEPNGDVTLQTKAWTFYLRPDSDEIVTEILNPYTGVLTPCPPLSGPISVSRFRGSVSAPPLDLRTRRLGDHAWVEVDRVSRFKPADTTWFKLEADLVSYACRADHLDDDARTAIPSTWSHNVVAEWQTWMKMHGTPGHILFKGDGAFIADLADAPAPLAGAIARHFPATLDALKSWR